MFNLSKIKYLFRCDDCQLIISVEFDEPEDLKKAQDNDIELDCPCGSKCLVIRN